MKNKFLKIYLLLFYLVMNNGLLANDFIFETSTIQITDKGNITNATNGIAKSNDGSFQITANKFLYNKSLSFLRATGNVEVLDVLNKTTFKSENIFYDIKDKIILSKTKSSIKNNLNNFFYLENFTYNLNSGIIKMNKVKIIDSDKNKIDLDKAFLNLNTNKLVGKDLSINFNERDFQNSNNPRLKGNSILSDGNNSLIQKGIFTTCKKNDSCPPWQITAEKIKHDKEKKILYYDDAWLKIYDKPVLYFPKFFHPDPTVKRQSGFLTPTFGDSSAVGSSLHVPYFIAISDSKDMTVTPRLYFDNKLLLQSEYRDVRQNSDHIADFSFISGSKEPTKSHFFSRSKKRINFNNFDESELTFRLEQTSNDLYLKSHKLKSPIIKDESTLTSSLDISAYRDDLNFDLAFNMYESLSSPKSDRFEYVFPNYSLSKEQKFNLGLNGNFLFNSNGYVKNYNTNVLEKVVVNDLIFNSNPTYSNFGFKNQYNFLIKNANNDSENSQKYNNDQNFWLSSIFEYNSSLPLKKNNDTLKPIVSLRLSPNHSRNNSQKDKRVDINNIYSLDRTSESDSVEGGGSLTYGIEYNKSDYLTNRDIFTAKVANIFRPEEDYNLPRSSRIGQKTSDIVGNINFDPNNYFKVNYDFSLDENLKDSNYQLISNEITVNNFINTFEYLNENNTNNSESYLSNKFAYNFNEEKKLSFNTRINKKTNLTEFYNLIYQYANDCLVAAIEYNKDYYSDRDLKPEENIFFKLTIIPFGETKSPNLKK